MDFKKNIEDLKSVLNRVVEKEDKIIEIARLICDAIKSGNKIIICGNGGSASQSQHFAAEMVGRFQKERNALAALSLVDDIAILSSVSNDYSYDEVFSRQLEALGKRGDVLVGLSTSGSSKNVVKAFEAAKKLGIKTVGILGKKGRLAELSDVFVDFEGSTPRVQEVHLFVIHTICEFVEDNL